MAEVNDRVDVVWDRVVAAIREVVVDLKITEDELSTASTFFDRMGAEGNFATLLFAALSTACLEAETLESGVTHANVVGPVYLAGAPHRPDGNLLEHEPEEGSVPLELTGRVYDATTGRPVPNAVLDVWQADHLGNYDRTGYHLRGLVPVDQNGRYRIRSVAPADYVSHVDDTIEEVYALRGRDTFRAAHVHITVWVDGQEVLTTQVFRSDSPRLDVDLVEGIVRPELITEMKPSAPGSGEPWRMEFDIPVRLTDTDAAGDGVEPARQTTR